MHLLGSAAAFVSEAERAAFDPHVIELQIMNCDTALRSGCSVRGSHHERRDVGACALCLKLGIAHRLRA